MCKGSDNWSPIGWPDRDSIFNVQSIYDVYCHDCGKFINLLDGNEIDPAGRRIIMSNTLCASKKETVLSIKELRKLKNELQLSISAEIFKLVEEFKEKTKVSPSSIYTDMVYVQTMGSEPEYVVGTTIVTIDI